MVACKSSGAGPRDAGPDGHDAISGGSGGASPSGGREGGAAGAGGNGGGAPGSGGVTGSGSGGGAGAPGSGGTSGGGIGGGGAGSSPDGSASDGGGQDLGAAPDGGMPAVSPRIDMTIDDPWKFVRMDVAGAEAPTFVDSSWTSLSLPHTWNNLDGQDGGTYYRGVGWYRRHITLPATYAGRSIYLQFDGSFLVTDVYVNGTRVGQHSGGFATFRFDVTSAVTLGADNVIAVKVTNAANANIPPLEGCCTFFGGLYRDVHLVVADRVHIDLDDLGSSGVYLSPSSISAASAALAIKVRLKNSDSTDHTVNVTATVKRADGTTAATATQAKVLAAGASDSAALVTTVSDPHLWNGRVDPYLYTVTVEITEQGTLRDMVTQPLGFRTSSVDPARGFSLNGTSLDLHGVNRHQDRLNKGWAISRADQDADMALVKELGATAIRLVHYQHGAYFYDLCDREGLVVWTELAMMNQITNSPQFTANARQQLSELIRQNYNHPSIFFWGMENEVIDNITDPNPLITELNDLAHAEDPARLTTVAANLGDSNPINWHTDAVGFNKYYGWYYGTIGGIGGWADGIHAAYPTRRIAVSEYGAGAGLKNHSFTTVAMMDHSEEYQALFHEGNWKALQQRPFVWGKFVWQMFDSASDGSDETAMGADMPGINDKGLIAFDHITKKDAFYFYKANWSAEPFVYITSRRFKTRTSTATSIKVYSNLASVSVSVNGVALSPVTSADHVFVWNNVTLASGANHVVATAAGGGVTTSDMVDWTAP